MAAESYSYDAAGNRAASSTDANYVCDANGRLMDAGGATYSYDNNGNITAITDTKGQTTYSYDLENRLVGAILPDGTAAAYAYDALVRRTVRLSTSH